MDVTLSFDPINFVLVSAVAIYFYRLFRKK